MSTGYLINDQRELHYLTFQVVRWIDIFSRQVYRDIIVDNLAFCQRQKGLEIYAFVIMSNHVHLLVRSPEVDLSKTVGEFKSYTAKKILEAICTETESRREWMLNLFEFSAKQHKRNERYQIWTHENHAEILYSPSFIRQKVNYIHDNPVRAGIVEYAHEYLYSSARKYAGLPCLLDVFEVELPAQINKIGRSVR